MGLMLLSHAVPKLCVLLGFIFRTQRCRTLQYLVWIWLFSLISEEK